jgi:hydrogenase nickel incorporation protein HypA/HybF
MPVLYHPMAVPRRMGAGEPSGAAQRGGDVVHELSIAQEIYRTSRAAVASHGAGRLERVTIAVGELTAVEPDLLSFAWEAVTAGGPDAGSALDVEWHPARQFCPACQADKPRAQGTWLRVCPDCGRPLEISGGQELDVLQVTFMPDGDAGTAGRERAGHG